MDSESNSAAKLTDREFADLVDCARAGCNESLGKLLQHCRNYLLGIANEELDSKLGGKVGASDIVQETMLDAQTGIGQFNGRTENDLLAWLRSILKHNLTDVFRHYVSSQKRATDLENPLTSGIARLMPADVATASEHLQIDEQEQLLMEAMSRLPDDYRQVIQLRNWELLSFDSVGEVLDRSEDAARKLWARAIERLQTEMQANDGRSQS